MLFHPSVSPAEIQFLLLYDPVLRIFFLPLFSLAKQENRMRYDRLYE